MRVASLLLSVAFGLAPSCGPTPTDGRAGRGVLVLAIDALRADHLEALGYDRETMPRLAELAQEGTLFREAWAAAPELVLSHASLLTGCDPNLARRPPLPDGTELAEGARWWIPNEVPRLARELLLAGFTTAAFVDHASLSPVYGFEAGFEHFTGYKVDTKGYELGFEAVGEKFLRWTQGLARERDWFAYVHVNDLERLWRVRGGDPKWDTWFESRAELDWVPPVAEADRIFFAVPRRRWERGGIYPLGVYEARYDGALRRINGLVNRLVLGIRQQGRWQDVTVIVVGTYGFGFGESGLVLDAGTLTDVDLHVPLIVRPAAWVEDAARGRIADELVSLVDVAPTVLALCGLAVPAEMQGRSFEGSLREGATPAEPVRERAFASGGLNLGFAVIERGLRFQHAAPGARHPGVLVESWYGEGPPERVEYRSHLVDRSRGDRPGDLYPSADLPLEAERLRKAGESYFRDVEARRARLHRTPWARD